MTLATRPVRDNDLAVAPDVVARPIRHASLVSVNVLGAVLLASMGWFAWSLPGYAARRTRSSTALVGRVGIWQWMFDHLAAPSSPGWFAVALVTVSVTSFGAWLGIVILTWRRGDRRAVRTVMLIAFLGVAIAMTALPNQTSDIYDYALFGRVVSAHDGHAYQDMPDRYPDDPVYQVASHRYTGSADNKLPAWTAASVVVTAVAGNSPLVTLFAFRVFLGAATVGTVFLVARVLRRLRPGTTAGGVAVFGLCPITLVYGASKTDALMALLAVAAVALVVDGRDRSATVLASLSVLVKLITLPVLVLVVFAAPRRAHADTGSDPTVGPTRRLGTVAGRIALAAATAAVAFGWLHHPVDVLRGIIGDSGASAGTVVPVGHRALMLGFLVVLVAVAALLVRADPVARLDRARTLITRSAWLLALFASFLTRPGLAWYLMSVLALVALTRSSVLVALIAALSACSFVVGWWSSASTRTHPLPRISAERPIIYLVVAATASVLVLVEHHRRRRSVAARSW